MQKYSKTVLQVIENLCKGCLRAPRAARLEMTLRPIFTLIFVWLLCMGSAFAEEGLPLHAEEVFSIGPFVVTNSMISIWIVAAVLIVIAQLATRKLSLIPSGLQNFVEWITEALYDFLRSLLPEALAKRTFWIFGTIFVLILAVNWAGLIPGVGTFGREVYGSEHSFVPYFRGGNADLNMTAAMSVTFMLLWLYWAVVENGFKGFLGHIFAPKGKFGGAMLVLMILIFGFVGILEVISILFRPVSLSFRLYGNIFAGENVMETMATITGSEGMGKWLGWLPPIPFYFLELLVGFIQAMVFMLLTIVYLKLITDHEEEHEEETAN